MSDKKHNSVTSSAYSGDPSSEATASTQKSTNPGNTNHKADMLRSSDKSVVAAYDSQELSLYNLQRVV